uniref:Uncharacterized protein n=1 Tax=Oryza punctata TaxID=4537 RepID=A0A0E0MKE6_ORYPU
MSGDGSGASGCGARWRLRMVVGGRDAVRSTTSDNFCRHLWRLCSGSATIARRPWMRVGRAAVAAAAANRFWRLRRRTSSLHTGDEPCSRSFKDPHLPEHFRQADVQHCHGTIEQSSALCLVSKNTGIAIVSPVGNQVACAVLASAASPRALLSLLSRQGCSCTIVASSTPTVVKNTSVKSYFQLTYLSMMVARVVLGTAPMTLSFFSPFLNMRTVGMLRMP